MYPVVTLYLRDGSALTAVPSGLDKMENECQRWMMALSVPFAGTVYLLVWIVERKPLRHKWLKECM